MKQRPSSTHLTLALLAVSACSDHTTASQGLAGSAPEMNMQPAMSGAGAAPMKGAEAGHPATMMVTGASGAPAMRTAAIGGSSGGTHDAAGASVAIALSSDAGGMSAGSSAGPSAGASGDLGNGAPSSGNRGTLPPVDDLEHMGPFMVGMMDNTGPGNNYRLIYPMPLGQDGLKHPVFSWGPGAGSTPDVYVTLLAHVASHGFVVLSYNSTPQGKELTDAIDWFVMQNQASSGMLSGKLDTDHVAVGGHSAGSLAAFVVAADPRITTTVHMSGGTFDPHTDNQNLRAPALFLCGQVPMGNDDGLTMGDLAAPNCEIDFMDAKTPVFYGSLMGGAHVTLIDVDGVGPGADDPKKLKFIGGVIGWLRWKLAGDESLKSMFVGSDCTLCKPDSGWTVEQKDLM